jgi:hypothetical protein
VSWIPGWGSIAGTAWWSGFYFWISICALIALGMAEVASHRYSDRKDELTAVEQETIQRHHDEDMARVQHDTATANERAAKLERENLDLRTQIAGRRITPQQHEILVSELSKNPGFFHIQSMLEGESVLYASDLSKTLKDANWTSDTPEFPLGEVWHGLVIFQTDDPAALRIAEALKAADIPFSIGDAEHKKEKATILVGQNPRRSDLPYRPEQLELPF